MKQRHSSSSAEIGHNSIAGDLLLTFVQRIEHLDEEGKALNADKRDIYAEARSLGFDVPTIKALIRERRLDPADRDEKNALLDLYRNAVDSLDGLARAREDHDPDTGEVIERDAPEPSTSDEPSPAAGPQAEAAPAGTSAGTPAGHEGSPGEGGGNEIGSDLPDCRPAPDAIMGMVDRVTGEVLVVDEAAPTDGEGDNLVSLPENSGIGTQAAEGDIPQVAEEAPLSGVEGEASSAAGASSDNSEIGEETAGGKPYTTAPQSAEEASLGEAGGGCREATMHAPGGGIAEKHPALPAEHPPAATNVTPPCPADGEEGTGSADLPVPSRPSAFEKITTGEATDKDKDDLLDIPAFLRRQAT